MIAHTQPQDEVIPAGTADRMNFGIGRENNATISAIGMMGRERRGDSVWRQEVEESGDHCFLLGYIIL